MFKDSFSWARKTCFMTKLVLCMNMFLRGPESFGW